MITLRLALEIAYEILTNQRIKKSREKNTTPERREEEKQKKNISNRKYLPVKGGYGNCIHKQRANKECKQFGKYVRYVGTCM